MGFGALKPQQDLPNEESKRSGTKKAHIFEIDERR